MNTFTREVLQRDHGQDGSQLLIGGLPAGELLRRYGSPLYVHDLDLVQQDLVRLAAALPGKAGVLYSVKANPLLALIKHLGALGCGAEVASGGELKAVLQAGIPPERIFFAGPGKTREEHLAALTAGIGAIHLESLAETERLATLGGRGQMDVGLRVNPCCPPAGPGMRMGGGPQPFGIDEEQLPLALDHVLSRPNLHLRCIHAYSATQIGDTDWLLALWSHLFELAALAADRLGTPLDFLNLGGGFAVPLNDREQELDLVELGRGLAALWEKHRDRSARRLLVEPGRFLVARGGVYLCRVVEVKQSRDRRYLILDGGMNHNALAAGTMGQVFRRDLPILAAERLGEAGTPCRLVGPLCTPVDELGRDQELPSLAPGDPLAFLRCGAYGLSASHQAFLSRPTAAEVVISRGQSRLARDAGKPGQWLAGQHQPDLAGPDKEILSWPS